MNKRKIIEPLFFIAIVAFASMLSTKDSEAFRRSSNCEWNAADHWCSFVPLTEYHLCYAGATGSCQGGGKPIDND